MRACCYRRVSTYHQLGNTSPEDQLARAKAFAVEQGWEWAGDYYDGAISGGREQREALDRLFADCRAGLIDVVLVGDLSRLTRDLRHYTNFKHTLQEELGVLLIDVEDPGASEEMQDFKAVFNAWMRRQIRANTARGRRNAALAGLYVGGPPPYGYKLVPVAEGRKSKRLAINDSEAETIRLATAMVVDQGLSLYATADRLNSMGRLNRGHHPGQGQPPSPSRWDHRMLRRRLTNPALKGEWVFSSGRPYTAKGDGPAEGRRRWPAGEPIPYPDMPAILSRDRWDALQRALEATTTGPKPASRVHPLSGRIFGECGSPFHGVAQARKSPVYRCKQRKSELPEGERCNDQRIRASDLEWVVWHEVVDLICSPGRLDALAARLVAQQDSLAPTAAQQLSALSARVARLGRALQDAYSTGLAVGLDPTALKAATARLQEDLDHARQAKAQLETAVEQARTQLDWLDRMKELAKRIEHTLMTNWAEPNLELMRRVFAELEIRVQVIGYRPLRVRITGNLNWAGLAELGGPGEYSVKAPGTNAGLVSSARAKACSSDRW